MKETLNDYDAGLYLDQMIDLGQGKRAFDIWVFTPKGLSGVYKEGVLKLLQSHGFRKMRRSNGSIYYGQVTGNVLEVVSLERLKEFATDYVRNLPEEIKLFTSQSQSESKLATRSELIETFFNFQDKVFNASFLSNLQLGEMEIIKDTKETAYVAFKNVVVKVTKEGIHCLDYSEFEGKLFFRSQIVEADFEKSDCWKDCHFAQFVKNVSNDDQKRKNVLRSAIGYLLHRYSDRTTSQAVYLYDEQLTTIDTPQGGTGKGLLAQSIKQLQNGFVRIDGKGINLKSPFVFQQVMLDTQVVLIDDVSRWFDVDRLNSVLSEGINVEKKHKTIIEIPKEEMPKFIISSNVILSYEGSTRERRQYIVQLSSYYSSRLKGGTGSPIEAEHGGMFFSDDWDKGEWDAFYTFMLKCLQFYLDKGLVPTPKLNLAKNMYIQKFGGHLYHYFEQREFAIGAVFTTSELYQQCLEDSVIDEETKPRGFTNALMEYLTIKGLFTNSPKKGKIKIGDKLNR